MANTEDLITLLAVAGRPVRVDEAAAALGVSPEEVLAVTEALVEAGQVSDTAEGIGTSENTPDPKSASRMSFLAGKWAEALDRLNGDPTEIGLAYLTAGHYEKAAGKLLPVALADGGEAAVEGALAAGEHGDFYSRLVQGRLLYLRGTHRRNAGDSLGAEVDIERSIRRLEGAELVDALGFASSIASDLQKPQQAEALAAMAVWRAEHIGDPARQGLLLTLHGRELSRVGFPDEADRVLEVGRQLVDEHGDRQQKDSAHNNLAWVMLDRGEYRKAEAEFGTLRDHAQDGDLVSLGSAEAYWARSLFGNGQAREALDAASRADDLADRTGTDAPRFLAALARTEGSANFGNFDEAVIHAQSALEVIRRSLPQWENMGLVGLARAYAGVGETEKAKETLEQALSVTPEGINGWRWRLHAQEVLLSLASAEEPWPQKEAEDLTDILLQARFFSYAAHLMCIRSAREKDPDLGFEAAALAIQIGNPMLAARAIESAGAWNQPEAVPVARAIRVVEDHVPDHWIEDWRSLASVSHALGVDVDVEVDSDELTQYIDDALQTAGLLGTDMILSPAQRQAKGLVRRRPRRRRSTASLVAAAAAVVVLAGATAFGVIQLTGADGEATGTTEPAPTTTTTLDTPVTLPDQGVFGSVDFRGGPERTGVFESARFTTPLGYFFEVSPGGSFRTDPMAYGRQLVLTGTTPNAELILLNMGSDPTNMGTRTNVALGALVTSPPAVGLVTQRGGGGGVALLVVGDEEGFLHGRNALDGTQHWNNRVPVDGSVEGTPLFVTRQGGSEIIVATDQGVIYGLNIDGVTQWTYEGSAQDPLVGVDRAMAYHDDILYIVDQDGVLHLLRLPLAEDDQDTGGGGVIDPSGGELPGEPIDAEPGDDPPPEVAGPDLICSEQYGPLAPFSSPIISKGVLYLPLARGEFIVLEADGCRNQPPGWPSPQIVSQFQFGLQFAPIVQDNIIYTVDNRRIVAIDASQNRVLSGVFAADSPISGSPVLAGGVIYFGTQGGMVHAVDPSDRSEIWSYDVGEPVFGSLAVIKSGAIFVQTASGTVIAIAVAE